MSWVAHSLSKTALPCWNKNISTTELISVASLKLFQSIGTCKKLCKCHLLSAHGARDNQLAPGIPWKKIVSFQDVMTCWNRIISLQIYITLKHVISVLNYFILTWNHNLRQVVACAYEQCVMSDQHCSDVIEYSAIQEQCSGQANCSMRHVLCSWRVSCH